MCRLAVLVGFDFGYLDLVGFLEEVSLTTCPGEGGTSGGGGGGMPLFMDGDGDGVGGGGGGGAGGMFFAIGAGGGGGAGGMYLTNGAVFRTDSGNA